MKLAPAVLIGLGSLASIMVATNPDEAAYTDFATNTVTVAMQDGVCQSDALDKWFGPVGATVGETCEAVIGSGADRQQAALRDVVTRNTEVNNYGLFTLYRTATPLVDDFRAVGVFNRFILL